ncbi:MAG: hypothetical protein Q8N67_03560 [Candidatus Omnitrophota bacterium]|nr:hypothetical protein [Candidatus Omnitrophota bacterium]
MKYVSAVVILCMFIFCSFGFTDRDWEQAKGIQEADIQDVCISPFDNTIYASTEKTLYRSDDKGDDWSAVFSSQGEDDEINFIGISEKGVFICAKKGLFKSEDGKSNWKRIFEDNAAHIAFSKDGKIFLGTKKGLFISMDNGLTWQKDPGEISNLNVRWIEFMDGVIFVAVEKGLYKNIDNGWKRTFVTNRAETEYDADIVDEDNQAIKPVNSIAAGKNNIFLATDSGIFFSEDKGETWKEFINAGLISLKVKKLIYKDNLCAATNKGVFMFFEQEKLWKPLYKGMPTKDTRDIAIDANGNLWAAAKKGLYKTKLLGVDDKSYESNENLESFNNEPGIREVQNAAIEYAEVNPGKIKEWRDSAAKKALLPNVSVGLDRYITDYWHWDSGTNPDTLQKGKDVVSWDITMSWNMGELIWNNDQTSIDTRSKLMVELRGDIMNEVTRTYFERRRLQIDLAASPIQDLKLSLEKELRLQELTADIDALTGGYFSRKLKDQPY